MKTKEVGVLAAGAAAATGAALAGMTILGIAPWAHADDLADEVCARLQTQNLWETTHFMSWEHHIDLVPTMIPIAFQAVHQRCPELSWRLPPPEPWQLDQQHPARLPSTGTAPAPPSPPEPEWYGDEPWGLGEELA